MDDNSSSTSCDDKSDFSENPTRDALADGLMSFLKPGIDNLYKIVNNVKGTQESLRTELELTNEDLEKIFDEDDGLSANFQKYSDKIAEMRYQLTVIDSVLQSAHNRLEGFSSKMQALQRIRKPHFDSFASQEQSNT